MSYVYVNADKLQAAATQFKQMSATLDTLTSQTGTIRRSIDISMSKVELKARIATSVSKMKEAGASLQDISTALNAIALAYQRTDKQISNGAGEVGTVVLPDGTVMPETPSGIETFWDLINTFLYAPNVIIKGTKTITTVIEALGIAEFDTTELSALGDLLVGLKLMENISEQDVAGVIKTAFPWIAKNAAKALGAASTTAWGIGFLASWAYNCGGEIAEAYMTDQDGQYTVLEHVEYIGGSALDSFGQTIYDTVKTPSDLIGNLLYGKPLSEVYADVGLEFSYEGIKEGVGNIADYFVDTAKGWVSSWWD